MVSKKKTKYVVATSKLHTVLLGWPEHVTLTLKQAEAMARIHLGGLEALRTPSYKVHTSTVSALVKLNLLGKNGPTDYGKSVAEALAAEGVC